ncbi:hypothetical protein DL93DRAFT_2084212 [Clavulina sp. PMI_390]|nr:hypothetical protein DL93DRAFT_2084212 [Clavulina sp. PMI_390]
MRHFFTTWHENKGGLRYVEVEITAPIAQSDPELHVDDADPNVQVHSPSVGVPALRIRREITERIPPDVFGDPSSWDPVAQAWYNRGTNRRLHRLANALSRSGPSPLRDVKKTDPPHPPFQAVRQPELPISPSIPGDAHHCLTLAYPFTVVKNYNIGDHPLKDHANIVISRLAESPNGGQRHLQHRLLLVRNTRSNPLDMSPTRLRNQSTNANYDVRPLQVRSQHMLWNPVAGILVLWEGSSNGGDIVICRVVLDSS